MSEPVSENIQAALVANPDLTVQTHEYKGERITRFSPKELIEAQGMAEARAFRRTRGIFQAARTSAAGPASE